MDMERALETQRQRLLRILAGLVLLLVLMSRFPAVSRLPEWVRASVLSVLIRAELAAHHLVIATASLQLREQSSVSLVGLRFQPLLVKASPRDDDCAEQLLRRIMSLRAVLSDLPKQAERLLRRLIKRRRGSCVQKNCAGRETACDDTLHPEPAFDERLDRPPDKRARALNIGSILTPS